MKFSIVYLYTALIVIGSAVNLVVWRKELSKRKVLETVLFWCLVTGVGLTGVTVFITLLFFPGTSVDLFGGLSGEAFRWDTGPAWLSVGLAGIACAKWRRGFWGATILISSIFLLGNAEGQFFVLPGSGTEGPAIYSPVFWYELLLPLVMVLLWVTIWMGHRRHDIWLEPLERKPS